MNKLYTKLFVVILFAFAIGGCKVDAPVYPEGTVPTPEFLSGHGGPVTGGGSIDNGSTITYTVDGKTTTLKPAFFQVISPALSPPSGSIQIGGGTDPATAFSLLAQTNTPGTYTDIIMSLGTSLGDGTVTFTEINTTGGGLKGTVKGTFSGKVTDFITMTDKNVSGEFSIRM